MPLYTVSVTSSKGWTYTATEGDVPSTAVRTHLGDGLSYRWSFSGEQVPGQLDPSTAVVRFVCKAMSDVPDVDKGDFLTLTIRLGTVGAFILTPPPLRVTAVEAEIDEDLPEVDPRFPVTVTVSLVDELAWLRALVPQPLPLQSTVIPSASTVGPVPYTMPRWRERLAQVALAIGRAIGAPTWWTADERPPQTSPPPPSFVTGLDERWNWEDNGHVTVEKILNSWTPGWHAHTLVPGYSSTPSTYPFGWQRVGPQGTNWGLFISGGGTPIAEPLTSHRFYVVPASRMAGATAILPTKFGVVDGILTAVPNVNTQTGYTQLAVDAKATSLPVKLRRSREHFVDQLIYSGQDTYRHDSAQTVATKREGRLFGYSNPLSSEIQTTRQLDTQLDLGDGTDSYVSGTPRTTNAFGVLNAAFFSDASARQAYAWDDFELSAAAMSAADQTAVLPLLAPRAPGEVNGDGLVVRHLTVTRVALDARPTDNPVLPSGFIARGQLDVKGGDLVYTLALAPGVPNPLLTTTAATPVTVGEVNAAAYGNTLTAAVDALIRIADLDYIDN